MIQILDKAMVIDGGALLENATLYGEAWVMNGGVVKGDASVGGYTWVGNLTTIEGDVHIANGVYDFIHWWKEIP